MAAPLAWLDQNWFSLLQTIGIIGSLTLATATLRRDTKARRATDLLSLLQQHRELWLELQRRPDLARITAESVDLVSKPITVAESEFLHLVIVHYHTGWMLSRLGASNSMESLSIDAGSFFKLPIPRAVWEQSKRLREPDFVKFIDGCIETKKS